MRARPIDVVTRAVQIVSFLAAVGLVASSTSTFVYTSQNTPPRPPVIDVHTHVTAESGPPIMDALNIRYAVVSGDTSAWAKLPAMANRYLPSLSFPCPGGRPALFGGPPCYETGTEFPDIAWVRGEVQAGQIKAFGEVLSQLLGLAPGDSRMEPYWVLAEEFDIPFAIHMGPGPPGLAYDSTPVPKSHPEFRMALGDPLLLEEVLLRHKRLRLSVMHAGWPRIESMLALLYAHPNVYVDTGGLQSSRIVPRAGYYRYLQSLVENGFGKRIMFGSDLPDQIEMGIDAIVAADFLSAEQKADILCNNAARFLRLDPRICQPR
jgi:amidohydrolase family protein